MSHDDISYFARIMGQREILFRAGRTHLSPDPNTLHALGPGTTQHHTRIAEADLYCRATDEKIAFGAKQTKNSVNH